MLLYIISIFVYISVVLVSLFSVLYGFYAHRHSYWRRKNVQYVPGKFPFGSITSVVLKRESFTEKIQEFYQTAKSKGSDYIGLYFFTRKSLLVTSPQLVKNILLSDFSSFLDRGIYYDEENDPLSAHLVAISGDRWKRMRQKVTPTFSAGKLKGMIETVLKCAEQLADVMMECGNDGLEMKELVSRYTTDVIGSCAFGIECNSLKNPEAEFRKIGRKVFQANVSEGLKRMFIRNFPWVAKKLKMKVINPEVSNFFIGAVKETVEYRLKENTSRKDFLQLLIALMDKGEAATTGNNLSEENSAREKALTINEVAAHAFVFFLAGFETSASTITFALFELASNVSIQQRTRREILRILQKYGTLTYEGLAEMEYTDKVLSETMRKYPAFTMLMRKCTQDYNLPGSNVILEKETPVIIPVYSLHHDPEFYPCPEVFNPGRFDLETCKSRTDHTYLPFGSGPRNCIGLRFAMIQMKVALASLLSKYKFTLNQKTTVPLVMSSSSFILTPLHGVWLNVHTLSKDEISDLVKKEEVSVAN